MRWCFLRLGKTNATTKRKLGIPKDLVERSSLSFCCRELIYDSEVRASRARPSKRPDKKWRTNQLHVNPRDSISGFLQSIFTNNEQKNWTNAVPQQGFGQQRPALPNKLRRYARMHTCKSLASVLEHMAQRMPHDSPFFICWAFSHAQVLSEMIILTLPRRESFWFSLCQRENLLEVKPVDVRLRRNEGREGKSF